MSICCVIPTNRPDKFLEFLDAWTPLFEKHDVTLYVIEDNPYPKIEMPKVKFPLLHFSHNYIPSFIPKFTGAIRSYGFLLAYREGFDITLTLDDDVVPIGDPIAEYIEGFNQEFGMGDYFDIGHIFGLNEYMRGYPMRYRNNQYPLLQYGGWDNVPDMDAVTQLRHEIYGTTDGYQFDQRILAIPLGLGFTGCIMNLAIRHDALPMMYQLMMGVDRVGYDRADDIWSGLFAKLKIPIVINGKALVEHTRASDTVSNLNKELMAYGLNEILWDRLKMIKLYNHNVIACYKELIAGLMPEWFGPQGHIIKGGMRSWIKEIT